MGTSTGTRAVAGNSTTVAADGVAPAAKTRGRWSPSKRSATWASNARRRHPGAAVTAVSAAAFVTAEANPIGVSGNPEGAADLSAAAGDSAGAVADFVAAAAGADNRKESGRRLASG